MCSCGNHDAHPIARRVTLDGVNVHVWSDGMVTDASVVAGYLPGVGRRRVPAARLWAFAGEVWLYPVADLASLVAEHQRAEKRQAAIDASRAVELHPNEIVGRKCQESLEEKERSERGLTVAASGINVLSPASEPGRKGG